MKPAAFRYETPTSTAEVTELLARHGAGARVLAGGQGMLPQLNAREIEVSHVIDLARVPDAGLLDVEDGALRVGPLVRLRRIARGERARTGTPLLATAVRTVASPTIRNRATLCGNLAYAHPASQVVAALVASRAVVEVTSARGIRQVPAEEIVAGPFRTTLGPDEWITQLRVPVSGDAPWSFHRAAFQAIPVVSVAARVDLADGAVTACSIGITGAAGIPYRARRAEELLVGAAPSPGLVADAADHALLDGAGDPPSTVHGSATYRRHAARVLVTRALADALGTSPREVAA